MKVNPFFLILALLAEILGTVGGFGSSVFFVPLGNFFLDFYSILGLTALLHLASNVSKLILFRKGLDKKLLVTIGIPSVLFVIVGAFMTKYFEENVLQVILAVFLIAFSLLMLVRKTFVVPANNRNSVLGGIFSGFSAGIVGTGGAIRGLTMAAFNLEKNVFIATSAFIDLFIDASRTIVYYRNGYIHQHDYVYIPFLFLLAWFGSYLGKRILKYLPQKNFVKLSLLLILMTGIVTVVNISFF